MAMQKMNASQLAALKKLESALQGVQRAGLLIVGIDDSLIAAVDDAALREEIDRTSTPQAVLERANSGSYLTHTLRHHGCYRDSGAC